MFKFQPYLTVLIVVVCCSASFSLVGDAIFFSLHGDAVLPFSGPLPSIHYKKELQDIVSCWTGEEGAWEGLLWKPRVTCASYLYLWSRKAVCSLLAGKRVAFAGDSITTQMELAFHSFLISLNFSYSDIGYFSLTPAGFGQRKLYKCGSRPDITVELLNSLNLNIYSNSNISSHAPLVWTDPPFHRDILVVNRGAHFVSTSVFLKEYNESLSYLQQSHPETFVLVRNTPLGHPDCNRATTILNEPFFFNHSHHPWGWHEFDHQNLHLKELVLLNFPEMLFLDVAFMMALRPDMHVSSGTEVAFDCLHWKEPILINWVLIFLNSVLSHSSS